MNSNETGNPEKNVKKRKNPLINLNAEIHQIDRLNIRLAVVKPYVFQTCCF